MTRGSIRRILTEENNPTAQSSQSDRELIDKEDHSLSPARVVVPKSDKFYGPSSLLFDEDAPSRGHNMDVNSGGHPLEPLSSKLVAEAATQRTSLIKIPESPVTSSTKLLT